MATTFDGLRDIIVRDFELPSERLGRDTPLEEIELDSLAVTELVFSLEDEFHVVAGNTNPGFKTLGDIADYIDALIAERDRKTNGAARSPRGSVASKIPAAKPKRVKSARPVVARSGRKKPAKSAALRKRGGSSAAGKGERER